MSILFYYLGLTCLLLFELANVYFIMPMPGSQEIASLDIAYFLHTWRMVFRGVFLVLILLGLKPAFNISPRIKLLLPGAALATVVVAGYGIHTQMAAETMFLPPGQLVMQGAEKNRVDSSRLVLGVELEGEAKAYPIQFLGYHHQVRDSVGGQPIMVTYCTVCRTGRIFSPVVQGRVEVFRLVGMDRYNAMFEDASTQSWWRQATGEAVTGKRKGSRLEEMPSTQTTLAKWLELHPKALIMQPDTDFTLSYDSMATYEGGRRYGRLTRYDTLSWQQKSWVAGISSGGANKAWDWNDLKRRRILHDQVGGQPIVVLLAEDGKSLFAFRRKNPTQRFTIQGDTLTDGRAWFDLKGRCISGAVGNLERINVHQEYWHSWKTFQDQ